MLLTNFASRQGIIYLSLAFMEMAWLTPIVMILYRPFRLWPSLLVFAILCAALLAWMLTVDLLNYFNLDSPAYELSVLGLIILSSIVLIIIWPYARLQGSGGLLQMFRALGNLKQGIPVEVFIILANIFLWQRATNATSREMSFFSVALSFRLGLLWLIVGGAVFTQLNQQGILSMLWLYFTLGLAAVAFARIDEKATDSRSMGKLLPRRRLAQLLGMITLVIAFTVLLSAWYTPDNLRRAVVVLAPLWQILLVVLFVFVRLLFLILEPLMNRLTPFFIDIFNSPEFQGIFERLNQLAPPEGAEQVPPLAVQAPDWLWVSARCGVIAIVVSLALGMALLLLDRTRRVSNSREGEQTAGARVTLGGNSLKQGWGRARAMVKLAGQYGLSRKLLAAISVENMYANICRTAARQGYPRPPAQAPDDYLPALEQAFMGHKETLTGLTEAYMQVHYGRYALTNEKLQNLQQSYYNLMRQAQQSSVEK